MKYILIGMILGLANVIPGVSGGTLAVSFNIFDRLIATVSQFRTNIKKEWKFLAFLGIGMAVGVLVFSNLVTYCLANFPVATNFFFLGVVFGSIPMVYKKAAGDKIKITNVLAFVVCLGIMVAMKVVIPQAEQTVQTNLTVMLFAKLLIYGAIASGCMIIPGISGSFVLMFLGAYETVMTAVATLNIPLLVPIAIGIIFGIVGCAKVVNRLLHNHANITYSSILGFVVGSVLTIYPGYNFAKDGVLPFALLVVGMVVTYFSNAKE